MHDEYDTYGIAMAIYCFFAVGKIKIIIRWRDIKVWDR